MMASRGRRPIRKPIMNKEAGEFEPCWEMLRNSMTDIHNKNASTLSFEQLYRASYKIVVKKKGGQLYENVKTFEEEWFQNHILPQISELITNNLVSVALVQQPGSSAHERRQTAEKFLRGVKSSWEDHNMSMNMIADILMYLDRTYTLETKRPSIFATTIGLFRDNILRNTVGGMAQGLTDTFTIFDLVCAVMLDLINMERDGDTVDRNLLRKITSMLEDLYETDEEFDNQRLYITSFEPRFLVASEAFYRNECEKLVREADTSSWLRHTQRRLAEEQDRCETTLSPLSAEKIADVIDAELIKAKLDEFLKMDGVGLKSMIDNDRVEDLSILYQLITRIDKTKAALKTTLQRRVMELGLAIEKNVKETDFSVPVSGAADGDDDGQDKSKPQSLTAAAQQTAAAIKWVDDVLQLKDKFDRLWEVCFQRDLVLQSAVTRSFSEFINIFPRSSEYVSLFIDDNLKQGSKGRSEAEIETVLDKAIVLLRYLGDRDMFERYYQKHLARRLLHNKSEIDTEKEMVRRMRTEMGNSFTAKFEGMFKDMELSKDLAENYREHIRELGDVGVKKTDLGINVLTSNNWPPEVMGRGGAVQESGARADCIYPPAIKRLQESFFKFYLKNRSGRILTWVGSAGSADIKCVFPKVQGKDSGPLSKERRYELNVPTYGMIVLMLFNDLPEGETLGFEEIQAKTNIPATDLTRTLASLSIAPKARVLLKDPQTKNIKATDRFCFNAGFLSKAIRIKAPTITNTSRVEGDEERKETERKNNQTRAHVVDAAIVRIMKQRKELSHTALTSEVISQLSARFKPDISLIKKRIEDLLTREYLERSDGDSASYRYLA
ncbi:Cullin [Podospora didyma]|uniref:Cullin n=1 Tax=Podospora didyma TaxID=330526 RepID=A0AAE0P516_9PEZI|nr:Cullin [Podospora didyma]